MLDGGLRGRFREQVAGKLPWFATAGEPGAEHARGAHTDELAPLWDEMTMVRRSVPGAQW
jgi:1,2-phenylacetyl-CoA epoxidase catalytic subunit